MAVRYFRYFPEFKYKDYVLRDITKLAAFRDTVNSTGVLYLPYTVREEETAEQVAFFYYGDVSYVWLVYFSNDMIDPYMDWPKRQNQLNDYITDQYLYACGVCTLKREPETIDILREPITVTADIMLSVSRGVSKEDIEYLQPSSDAYDEVYEDIYNWLKSNNNNNLPDFISDQYGIENYAAIQETLQEIIDNGISDTAWISNSKRPRLASDLITNDLWDINGDGILDSDDLQDVKKFALGQYDDITPSQLSSVRVKLLKLSQLWLNIKNAAVNPFEKPYSNQVEADVFRLGRPMDYAHAYDYLIANVEEGLAEILIKIPNREELKKTLNVLLWTMDTTLTKNIIHYQNKEDPELRISADTYEFNQLSTTNDWIEFDRDDWEPVRIYDYEFLQNEEKRNIKLIGAEFASDVEGVLEGIMKQ